MAFLGDVRTAQHGLFAVYLKGHVCNVLFVVFNFAVNRVACKDSGGRDDLTDHELLRLQATFARRMSYISRSKSQWQNSALLSLFCVCVFQPRGGIPGRRAQQGQFAVYRIGRRYPNRLNTVGCAHVCSELSSAYLSHTDTHTVAAKAPLLWDRRAGLACWECNSRLILEILSVSSVSAGPCRHTGLLCS